MNENISNGLRALTDEAVARALTDWQLVEAAVPADFALVEGHIREHRVRMVTRRFGGSGYQHLTVARIDDDQGRTLSATIIGLPRFDVPLPIIGIDVIAIGGALSLVAVDLAPTDLVTWRTVAVPHLEALHHSLKAHVTERKRPDFTQNTFSDRALIVAAKKGSEDVVLSSILTFVRSLAPLLTLRQHDANDGGHALQKWLRAELSNRKEHDALSRIFGAEFAARYLGDFLFALSESATG